LINLHASKVSQYLAVELIGRRCLLLLILEGYQEMTNELRIKMIYNTTFLKKVLFLRKR
jgi:hypothetical protein